jgi:hypothetical protein
MWSRWACEISMPRGEHVAGVRAMGDAKMGRPRGDTKNHGEHLQESMVFTMKYGSFL